MHPQGENIDGMKPIFGFYRATFLRKKVPFCLSRRKIKGKKEEKEGKKTKKGKTGGSGYFEIRVFSVSILDFLREKSSRFWSKFRFSVKNSNFWPKILEVLYYFGKKPV